jgi:choline kinase
MKAIILAAGRGSRMKSKTDDNPKCLVKLDGEALLDRQLRALRDGGADQIAIVTGYRGEMLEGRADATFHNPRWSETNMVSSLATASDWLEREPVIISYSDIFYDPSAVEALRDCDADIAITFDRHWERLWEARFDDPLLDAETFRTDGDGRLVEIGGKPRSTDEIKGQYMGLLRFSPAGWAEFQAMREELDDAARDKLDMTSALQNVIRRGRVPIAALPYEATWGEIDSEDDLAVYEAAGKSG